MVEWYHFFIVSFVNMNRQSKVTKLSGKTYFIKKIKKRDKERNKSTGKEWLEENRNS